MPCSAEDHRIRTGTFHPRFIVFLTKKSERSLRAGKADVYSPYVYWDCFTDMAYRCVLTTLFLLVFLVSCKGIVSLLENLVDLSERVFQWWSGCMTERLQHWKVEVGHWQTAAHGFVTGPVSVSRAYCPPLHIMNPLNSDSLLALCGDIELNPGPINKPGPTTDERIEKLGHSLREQYDTVFSEIRAVCAAVTTLTSNVQALQEELRMRVEDIDAVKKNNERLEHKLEEVEEYLEKQQILSRSDNIVFYGIDEPPGEQESEEKCVSLLVAILNDQDTNKVWDADDISQAYRLGRRETEQSRPRPMLVKFVRRREKNCLIKSKLAHRRLREQGIHMDDDMTVKQRDTLRELRDQGMIAYYRGTKLFTKPRPQRDRRARADDTDDDDTGQRGRFADPHQNSDSEAEVYPTLPPSPHQLRFNTSHRSSLHARDEDEGDTHREKELRQHTPRRLSGGRGRGRGVGHGSGGSHGNGLSSVGSAGGYHAVADTHDGPDRGRLTDNGRGGAGNSGSGGDSATGATWRSRGDGEVRSSGSSPGGLRGLGRDAGICDSRAAADLSPAPRTEEVTPPVQRPRTRQQAGSTAGGGDRRATTTSRSQQHQGRVDVMFKRKGQQQ